MSLTGIIIGLITRRSARRFERAAKDAARAQRERLLEIVGRNKDTEYGRRHGFSEVRDIKDYQARVPVVQYEDLRGDMERVMGGARNVFTAEDPVMFAQTSGTAGAPKLIPVTPSEHGRAHVDVMRTWQWNCQQAHPGIYDGKIVSLVSPAVEGRTSSGVPFGSTSGHMYKNMPWIVRRLYAVPYGVFEIEDYQSKYYAIMRLAMTQDVRLLCSANPSSVLKLCEKGNEFGEDIIRDVRDGTLSKDLEMDPDLRRAIGEALRPDPGGARALEAARRRRDGVLKPADYWPRLCLIGCWKGGTVGHYLDKFDAWFDPDGKRAMPVRDWGYLASEMRGSIPLSDEGSHGALTVATNVFEFAEVKDVEADPDNPSAWRFRAVGEVEDGMEYYIFVTTASGLYRYDMNDIVRITGHYHRAPQIAFLRKGRGMTNLTGEKLSVNQVIEAFAEASKRTRVMVSHFKAEAEADKSRYLFRVEAQRELGEEAARDFLRGVDDALKEINLEYKGKRDSMRLAHPVLHVMREGWYERGRRRIVNAGRRQFQAKTEILSPMKWTTRDARPEIVRIVEWEPGAAD